MQKEKGEKALKEGNKYEETSIRGRGGEDGLGPGAWGSAGGREGLQTLRDTPAGPAAPPGSRRGGWRWGEPGRGLSLVRLP